MKEALCILSIVEYSCLKKMASQGRSFQKQLRRYLRVGQRMKPGGLFQENSPLVLQHGHLFCLI